MGSIYEKLSKEQKALVDSRVDSELSRVALSEEGFKSPLGQAYAAALSRENQKGTQRHLIDFINESTLERRAEIFGTGTWKPNVVEMVDPEKAKVLHDYITTQREVLSTPESLARLAADREVQLNNAIQYEEQRAANPLEARMERMLTSGLDGRLSTVQVPAPPIRSEEQVRADSKKYGNQAIERMSEYQYINGKPDGTNPNAGLPVDKSGRVAGKQ